MAPSSTESEILASYLLEPASLPTILPYSQFLTLFPSQYRSNPQVKLLYRDLQFLRSVDIDVIQDNIAQECKKGDRMKVDMLRALHAGEKNWSTSEEQHEVEMDLQLFGPAGSLPARDRRHTVDSLLREMEYTCRHLELEAQQAGTKAKEMLRHTQETVGGLSDLRYGKFAKTPSMEMGRMEGEVVKALRGLEDACDQLEK